MKKQSKELTERGELAPKKAKTILSAGKVMASVVWDPRGIIFINYLEKGKKSQRRVLCELTTVFK